MAAGGLSSVVTDSTFCSPFDDALAHSGPAAVFLLDPEGALRFQPNWTRDAWSRSGGPHEHGWRWVLLRDQGSGFVLLALATSPTLLDSHPRFDVRQFVNREDAEAVRRSFWIPGEGRDGRPVAVTSAEAFAAAEAP